MGLTPVGPVGAVTSPAAATAAAAPSDPVIIVEGTGSSEPIIPAVDYNVLAGRLEADGHQAFVFPLPGRGLG
ncbi:MAG TPA: hypothetical protein VGO78_04955, partial [Acidimicrobiales bacterium]|nr:hypothetical protein [Acidimicrobiales bacterium]